jgi:hypothetical protein
MTSFIRFDEVQNSKHQYENIDENAYKKFINSKIQTQAPKNPFSNLFINSPPIINPSFPNCTYGLTGKSHKPQYWKNCLDCYSNTGMGACLSCIETCHKGHDLGELEYSNFFCDCGDYTHPYKEVEPLTPKDYIFQAVSYDPNLVVNSKLGLAKMLYLAYCQHLNVTIKPDDIWILIINVFQTHINLNAELLRKNFVDFNGKKTIVVVRNDFVLDANNPWHEVFDEFALKCKENIVDPNLYHLLTDKFSTSTPIDLACYNIGVMSSLKSYFNYLLKTLCGIAGINIEGNKEDWINLRQRVIDLGKFMEPTFVDKWFQMLIPVLDEFVNVFDFEIKPSISFIDKNVNTFDSNKSNNPKINYKFWSLIFKEYQHSGSGAFNAWSGWFNIFYPYLKGDAVNEYIFGFKSVDHFINNYKIERGIDCTNLENVEFSAPVKWQYYLSVYDLEFRAGAFGVYQNKETLDLHLNNNYYVFRITY